MRLKEFRTYKRRTVTRKSGFKASGKTTGGECKVLLSKKILFKSDKIHITYRKEKLELVKLFLSNKSIVAFGLYILPESDIKIKYNLKYNLNDQLFEVEFKEKSLKNHIWNSCGFYNLIETNDEIIYNIELSITITQVNFNNKESSVNIALDHFGIIDYEYYVKNNVYNEFLTKTNLNIPHIFYFNNETEFLGDVFNKNEINITDGEVIVLKSCNRCMRFLPINIEDERNTLAFSSHCVKRAPCIHSKFRNYNVIKSEVKKYERINENNEIISYYGHQLECKACKKYYVNAPLNPQRNPEQFKEDGLRRRAFEMLVNNLLDKDLVHHEYKKRTKKEFTDYIYNKFNKKCFKCGKVLTKKEMHLDHTMPLAYLYRLDETATCLCSTHNSSKNDRFPSEFYTDNELKELSKITGIPYEKIILNEVNMVVVNQLVKNIEWFFDIFLADKNYQKVRKGILTADKIYNALIKVIPNDIDLVKEYQKIKGDMPKTITIK